MASWKPCQLSWKSRGILLSDFRENRFMILTERCRIHRCIKAAILPSRSFVSFCTQRSHDLRHAKFHQTFHVLIDDSKLASKTLQVHIWSINERNEEECLVGGLLSLSLSVYISVSLFLTPCISPSLSLSV